MRKARLLLMSAVIAAMSIVPLGGTAHACPDPDNPCDPPPMEIEPYRTIKCKILKAC